MLVACLEAKGMKMMIADLRFSGMKLCHPQLAQKLEACLTDSERRVVFHAMTIKGLTTRQVAGYVGCSPHTIEAHKKNIRAKASEVYNESVTFSFAISELKCYFVYQQLRMISHATEI